MRESLPWIAVDVDGVLADIVQQTFSPISEYLGRPFGPVDVAEWDFPVGARKYSDFIMEVLRSCNRLAAVPPIDGAANGVRELFKHRRIAIVTARPTETRDTTLRWLAKFDIPYDFYAHQSVGEKHRVEVPCELLIDDHIPNITGFVNKTPGRGVLFPQRWNTERLEIADKIDNGKILTPADWSETVSMIL